MKKIILFIFIVPLILVLLVHYTVSIYFSQINGNVTFSVAKPVCRAIIEDNKFYISNNSQNIKDFSVCNFDEKQNITEVAIQYYITIKLTQAEAPLIFSLYRIYDDNSEEKINIELFEGNIKTTTPITMYSNSKQIHNYRLKTEYNTNSSIDLDKNIGISIILESEQVEPK